MALAQVPTLVAYLPFLFTELSVPRLHAHSSSFAHLTREPLDDMPDTTLFNSYYDLTMTYIANYHWGFVDLGLQSSDLNLIIPFP